MAFLAELAEITNLIEAQLGTFSMEEIKPLADAQAKAVVARLQTVTLQEGDAIKITEVVQSKRFWDRDQQKRILMAINAKSVQTSIMASTKVSLSDRRDNQRHLDIPFYLVADLLDTFEDVAVPDRVKIHAFADHCSRFGLMWPDGPTLRHIVGVWVFLAKPSIKQNKLAQYDVKTQFIAKLHDNRSDPWGFAHVVEYPTSPTLLPEDIYEHAFGRTPPCDVTIDMAAVNVCAHGVPLRYTHKDVREFAGPQHSTAMVPAHGPGQQRGPSGTQQEFQDFLQQMVTNIFNGHQNPTSPPPGRRMGIQILRPPGAPRGNINGVRRMGSMGTISNGSAAAPPIMGPGSSALPLHDAHDASVGNQSGQDHHEDHPALDAESPPGVQIEEHIEANDLPSDTPVLPGLFSSVVMDPMEQANIMEAARAKATAMRKQIKAEETQGSQPHPSPESQPCALGPERKKARVAPVEVSMPTSVGTGSNDLTAKPPEPLHQNGTTLYNGGKLQCSLSRKAWRVFTTVGDRVDKPFSWKVHGTSAGAWAAALEAIDNARAADRATAAQGVNTP